MVTTVISNEMVGMAIALLLIWYFLMENKLRLWRLMGQGLFILTGIGMVTIADNLPMYVLSLVIFAVGGIKFAEEVPHIIPGWRN